MTPVRFSLSALRQGSWSEYLIRFVLGGGATVFTGLISSYCGAYIGGAFLALPAIFCASATLIEKHEIRRKRQAGLNGTRRGAGRDRHAGVCDCVLADGGSQRPGRLHRRIVCLADLLGCCLVCAPQHAISATDAEAGKRPCPAQG